MPSSSYLRGKLIDLSLRQVPFTTPAGSFVALHTADPTIAGIAGTEVSGAWYGRQSCVFAAQSTPGLTSNAAIITFNAVTTATVVVTHFSVWDASTLGNMMIFAALSAPKTFNPTDVPSWLAGSLVASLA